MDRIEPAGFFDRTFRTLRRALRDKSDVRTVAPDLPDSDRDLLKAQIDACLEGRGGEVSARARAAELGQAYLDLSQTGRERFLRLLASDYDVDHEALETAIEAVTTAPDKDARQQAERHLRAALVPPRVKLLTQFNALSQGVKFLVDMRGDLLPLSRASGALKALDDDLRDLLVSWFDVGFLNLQRITWDAPAALLEKLIAYEAVHEIRSWADLKNRLGQDRRCFAFFHPSMPDEPLIFVQVALVHGIADNVQELLDESTPELDPDDADTAIFYSITNAQKGLAGVSFGDFLIKRVADDLSREAKNLKTFATLSPVPGFRAWLDEALETDNGAIIAPAEAEALVRVANVSPAPAALRTLLSTPDWLHDRAAESALKPVLLRLCAHYLIEAQPRRGTGARDRVAHFHLSNGARLERLNWRADSSDNGLRQSAGIMVNYLYKLSDIEKNHESYTGAGRITAAQAVRKLAKD